MSCPKLLQYCSGIWQVLRKHLLKDSLKPGPLHTMLTRTSTLQDAHWPPCINTIHTEIPGDNLYAQQHTVSMWGSRPQNHVCQLPHPQFLDRDFTAKNIRGFISDTKTPSSSHRYPETPKRAHWISAQRAHNSSQTLKHNWDHNHTHCDKDPPNRPKSSRRKQMKTADTSHHGESLPNHSTLTDLIQKP